MFSAVLLGTPKPPPLSCCAYAPGGWRSAIVECLTDCERACGRKLVYEILCAGRRWRVNAS